MTRTLVLAAASMLALAACHPPSLKSQALKLGHQAAAIVKPTVKAAKDHPEVVNAVVDIAAATVQAKVADQVNTQAPVTLDAGQQAPTPAQTKSDECTKRMHDQAVAALDHGAGTTVSCH